jgi:hypothetical protein
MLYLESIGPIQNTRMGARLRPLRFRSLSRASNQFAHKCCRWIIDLSRRSAMAKMPSRSKNGYSMKKHIGKDIF